MFRLKQKNIISSSFADYIQFTNKRMFQKIIKQHQHHHKYETHINKKETNIHPNNLLFFILFGNYFTISYDNPS